MICKEFGRMLGSGVDGKMLVKIHCRNPPLPQAMPPDPPFGQPNFHVTMEAQTNDGDGRRWQLRGQAQGSSSRLNFSCAISQATGLLILP